MDHDGRSSGSGRKRNRSAQPEPSEQFIRFSEDGINLTKELEQYENRLIGEALRKANGITSRAAQLLHSTERLW